MKTSNWLAGVIVCLTASLPAQDKQHNSTQHEPLASTTQILVVTTSDWSSLEGTLRRYERRTLRDKWSAVGEPIAVVVGKNGLGWGSGAVDVDSLRASGDPDKKEGDGKAPAGVFRLGKAFGYADGEQSGWKMPYLKLTPAVECIDDSKSRFYNMVVDRSTVSPDWNSSEQMRRQDELYRWGIVVEHNMSPVAIGGGSCIFMHIWHGPGQPTVGCTAMPQSELEGLLSWLDSARQPLLVQMPSRQYQTFRKRWRLPDVTLNSGRQSKLQHGKESVVR